MKNKVFDLNIESILEDWEPEHAIREIIANALDEQKITDSQDIVIKKNRKGQWIIRDYGRGLNHKHLTQNENPEKLEREDLIGKFGIGLKDALATLDRHGIDVIIKSRYGEFTISKNEKHGFEDLETLHVIISEPEDVNFSGTEFIFEDLKDQFVDKAKKLFLKFLHSKPLDKTKYGEIYEKVNDVANIFINGVKVSEEENHIFDYNITNLNAKIKKALNRERSNVGRSAYSDRVKAILLSSKNPDVMQVLKQDLKTFMYGNHHDELSWIDVQKHAVKILNSTGNTVFITNEEAEYQRDLIDDMRRTGQEVVYIPGSLKENMTDEKDINDNPIRDMGEYVREYNESFEYDFVKPNDLSNSEYKIFIKTNRILRLYGPTAFSTDNIKISNNIRPSLIGDETQGVYESGQGLIVIKRTQLSSVEDFAGTLIHELIHATTNTIDVTRDFENELTKTIGYLVRKAI